MPIIDVATKAERSGDIGFPFTARSSFSPQEARRLRVAPATLLIFDCRGRGRQGGHAVLRQALQLSARIEPIGTADGLRLERGDGHVALPGLEARAAERLGAAHADEPERLDLPLAKHEIARGVPLLPRPHDHVDRIEAVVAETGETGFHFVDEAAPPKALKAMAEELLRRGRVISWWGNIRFEKTFSPEVCRLLAQSGCIAITGGLEVASDRLLQLMKKGVSVAQVAQVTRAFSDAGILVHAYLMYGFPTQTVAETIDSLEYVRQLFEEGCIQSGFFHRFACTVHSPVGRNPAAYGVKLAPQPFGGFARNDVAFIDPSGVDHDALGEALNAALYNYMHGVALERDVREWFAPFLRRVPRSTVHRDFVRSALSKKRPRSAR